MRIRLLTILVLVISLQACGVRTDETAGSAQVTGEGTEGVVTTVTGTGDSVAGEEGSTDVTLQFFDGPFSGYWRNDTRSSSLSTEIVRITFGERYFHVQSFIDQSTGSGSSGLNCYSGGNYSYAIVDGLGLRPPAQQGNTADYSEWTVAGDQMQSTVYDENGEAVENSTGTATHTRVFTGLSAADLPICTS